MSTIHTPVINQSGNAYEQPMTYIDEPNLYRCIFQSRKQEAEQLQNWVFEVVLPQIRKTGGYLNLNVNDDDNTILARALMIAQKTIELKDNLLEWLPLQAHVKRRRNGCRASVWRTLSQ